MGVFGKRNTEKHKWTEEEVQSKLGNFMSEGRYRIENLFVYRWESDYIYVTKSDYVYEIEIKVSRSDFFNDKKKEEKHKILEGTYQKKLYEKEYPQRPNFFYYGVPEGLIKPEEVPEYAGLLYVTEMFPYVEIIKSAPKIHSDKMDINKLKLTDKFYYNYIAWKRKSIDGVQNLKSLLEEAKTVDGTTYKLTLPQAHRKIEQLEETVKDKSQIINSYNERLRELLTEIRQLKNLLVEKGVTQNEIENKLNELILFK